jgi:diguanylate cyclase (GGDEF)-like protein
MAQLDAVYAAEPRRPPGSDAASALAVADPRRRAAEHRARAAEHRELAARDREAAARDREQAAADRRQALADREALARQLELAETDPLTGSLTRAAGLMDLEHELDRCRRTSVRLVVAYVDVVGLKKLNDSAGHAAGDDLLRRVVTLMEANLRSYDLVIRVGGDEFLSVMSSMTLIEARRRFERVAAAVAESPGGGGIRTGFAELEPTDTPADLMARADTELIARHG